MGWSSETNRHTRSLGLTQIPSLDQVTGMNSQAPQCEITVPLDPK